MEQLLIILLIICCVLLLIVAYHTNKWLRSDPEIHWTNVSMIIFLFLVIGYIGFQIIRKLIEIQVL
jgi:hypothetical protein